MPSSISSSSSDETPRAKVFDDFDFFDSDDDKKPNSKTRQASSGGKNRHDDELHGRGIKSKVPVREQEKYGSSSDADDQIVETKTRTTFTQEKLTVREEKKNGIPVEKKEHVTIRIPYERTARDSDDDSSSVTDVSPLQSPNPTPRPRSALRRKKPETSPSERDVKKESKTKFVIKESGLGEDERPHARRSNGEALSVEDLFYSSDGTPVSSSERDMMDAARRKKVQRKKRSRHDEIQYRMEASTRHHRRRLLDVAAQNSMDISQLLEVVLEMEQENKARRMLSNGRAPREMGLLSMKPPRKRNMSFTNDQVRDIDKENQRLLKRLSQLCTSSQARPSSASSMRSSVSLCRSGASVNRSNRRPATASGIRHSSTQGPRVSHSAINRIRDQQRIERENLALLKRLQSTRASSSLQCNNLLRDYERQTGKAVEPTRPRRRQRSGCSRQRNENSDGRPSWQDSW